MNTSEPLPLNKQQLEILKLFSRELKEEDLLAIKRLIVQYLAQKVTELADETWEEKGWSNEDIENLLQTHQRAPYITEN